MRIVARVLFRVLVVPAYAFAALVFGVFIIVLGVVLASRVIDAVRDYGPTYSVVAMKKCLEERGRTLRGEEAGAGFVRFRVEQRGRAEGGELTFLRTPREAHKAAVSDSEEISRDGNVLFPEMGADGLHDPAIEACLEQARRGD